MSNILVFPGGAGGSWVSSLVHRLENNVVDFAFPPLHYHYKTKTESFVLSHDYYLCEQDNIKFLNSQSLFSVYVNVVYKLRIPEFKTMPIEDRFEIMASESSSKLFFTTLPFNLTWDDVFKDQDKFIFDLYTLLDNWGIVYNKTNDIILPSIEEYKKTCIDDTHIVNDFNNEIWLGWCNGIMKHEFNDWKIIHSIEQAQDILYPRAEYFQEYTMNKILAL